MRPRKPRRTYDTNPRDRVHRRLNFPVEMVRLAPMPGLSSELADEPDFWFEMVSVAVHHSLLRVGNQGAHIGRGRVAQIHEDVRVDM